MSHPKPFLLFKVIDTFFSPNGQVLLSEFNKNIDILSGTKIKLILPDRSEIETQIIGISFEGNVSILVPIKSSIPLQTEVWTLKSQSST